MSDKLIALLTIFAVCCFADGYNITDLQSLTKNLLEDRVYDTTIRPVVDQSKIVEIEISLAMTSIIQFDMVSGRIAISGFLFASWTDEQLLWNPFDFNGISKILVAKDAIWTPGLKNAFDLDDKFDVSRVNIYPNGLVTWLPANTFYSICFIDITYYPYDEHECQFPIFSTSDDSSTIKFVPLSNEVNLQNFHIHGEWDVSATTSEVSEIYDPILQFRASMYIATLKVKRRPRFAILHTYFPLLLITCVNILTFMVPLDKGERVSFSITLLLALVFFTSNMSETLPHSSLKMSYFSAAMALAICSSTVAVMLSIILVKIDAETIRPVPQIFNVLVSKYKHRVLHRSKKNTVFVLQDIDNNVSFKELAQTHAKENEHTVPEPSEVPENPVTWSEVAYTLNKICMLIYSVLLGLSVTVLVVMHHSR